MGTGVERTRVAVAGPRLAECGTNGAGADPAAPHSRRETERAGLRVAENGVGRAAGSNPRPHTQAQINLDERRGA